MQSVNPWKTAKKEVVLQDRENYWGGFVNTKSFFDLHPQLISSACTMEIPFDMPLISSVIQSKAKCSLPSLVSWKTCLCGRWWPNLAYLHHFKSLFFLWRLYILACHDCFNACKIPNSNLCYCVPAQHHKLGKQMKPVFCSGFWSNSDLTTLSSSQAGSRLYERLFQHKYGQELHSFNTTVEIKSGLVKDRTLLEMVWWTHTHFYFVQRQV